MYISFMCIAWSVWLLLMLWGEIPMHPACKESNFIFSAQQIGWRVYFLVFGDNIRSCTLGQQEEMGGQRGRQMPTLKLWGNSVFLARKISLRWMFLKAFCTLCFLQCPAMHWHGAGPVLHAGCCSHPACSHSLPLLVFHLVLVDPLRCTAAKMGITRQMGRSCTPSWDLCNQSDSYWSRKANFESRTKISSSVFALVV